MPSLSCIPTYIQGHRGLQASVLVVVLVMSAATLRGPKLGTYSDWGLSSVLVINKHLSHQPPHC